MTRFDITQGLATGSLGQSMTGSQMVDRLSSGVSMETRIVDDASIELMFPKTGDIGYRLLVKRDCGLSLKKGRQGQLQRMTLVIQQPYGGNCEVEFATSINWQDGQPFIDTRIGSVIIVEILFDGINTFYGRLIYG